MGSSYYSKKNFTMKQVSILICLLGVCCAGLVKRDADPEADADADPGYGHHGYGGHTAVAVGPVAASTQCHTEYDVAISQACNTVTEQACTTVPEQVCNTVTDHVPKQECHTVTEQACHTETDTVIDTTHIEQCKDIV